MGLSTADGLLPCLITFFLLLFFFLVAKARLYGLAIWMDSRYGYKGLSTFCRVGFRRGSSARWGRIVVWLGLFGRWIGCWDC